jgi:putative two-component system response regulator
MATVRAAPKILMVDDSAGNLQVLRTTLEGCGYRLLAARNGAGALSVAAKAQPDLILLDIVMPDMDGYDVCRRLKAAAATRHIPVIFLTALDDAADEAKGLALGAVDYIAKPIHPELVRARVHTHLELKRHQDHLKGMVTEKTREVRLTQAVMIESLGTLAEYRDPETGGHIKRTQNYVKALAVHLRGHPRFRGMLNEETIELLYRSAPLHDVGKVGVRDHILLKAGRLDEAEFEQMKLHTLFGEEALHRTEQKLGRSSFLRLAREIAGTHQEKWNGSGYPRGLKGDAIPFSGRLMAVADVYDALISKRIYKPPLPHEKAVAIIRAGQGVHFDPDLVDAFLELEKIFRNIAIAYADFDEEREMLGAGRRHAPPPGCTFKRVLLVDDNEISLEIMKNQLTTMEFAVDTAANGRQALWKYRTADYGLILTDLEMPELSGLGLLQAIRSLEKNGSRRTPVLAITAADFELTASGAAAAGFDGHMLKPLDLGVLKRKLDAYFQPIDS